MLQKLKTQKSEDFLVGGYIPGRYGVEQLVVGEKRDAHFYFIDSVKNGFVPGTRQRVFEVLQGKETERCPSKSSVKSSVKRLNSVVRLWSGPSNARLTVFLL
jgi:ATP-dependent DNA ligase